MIYFMKPDTIDMVKVGWTKDHASLEVRRQTLQTGHPWRLSIIRVIPDGGRSLEGWFHSVFADYRLSGEWFSYHSWMLDVPAEEELTASEVQGRIRIFLIRDAVWRAINGFFGRDGTVFVLDAAAGLLGGIVGMLEAGEREAAFAALNESMRRNVNSMPQDEEHET